MFSNPKFFLKIVLAEIRVHKLIFQKTKKFISVRIELTEGLDYLRLREYP